MKLDKSLEVMLTKKVALERLKVEDETLKSWKERIEESSKKSNDFISLETNIKRILQNMENRLRIIQSQMQDLT